jgi:lipopolysaccharide biosynthesis protein
MTPIVKLIAFYLPQFHPIPENDAWWGKGFTEWRNVVRAKPLFKGHYQPQLPSDLGFYDLRLTEARQAQADLARKYGVYGFCYYHYWFGGKRLLNKPLDSVLKTGAPDLPFCICWANENWTKKWDGLNREILIQQKYSSEDDEAHIRWLCKVITDKRYITIKGKPLILIYKASLLPEPRRTIDIWRSACRRNGVGDIYLARVESFAERGDPTSLGFDASIEFQPNWKNLPNALRRNAIWKILRKMGITNMAYGYHSIYDYEQVVSHMLAVQKNKPAYVQYHCVMPAWDNSPRTKTGYIFRNSTPKLYEHWLEQLLKMEIGSSADEKIVFINAWNEWAEGCHLEPDQKYGRAYLEATRTAMQNACLCDAAKAQYHSNEAYV